MAVDTHDVLFVKELISNKQVFPSGSSTSMEVYNTSDQLTNYERLKIYYTGNTATIASEAGGTGTYRDIVINAGAGANSRITLSASASPFIKFGGNSSVGSVTTVNTNPTFTNSSGTTASFSITPTVNTSGTASSIDFLLDRTQTAIGSGAQYLMELRVGGSRYLALSSAGVNGAVGAMVFLANATTAPTSNPTGGGFLYCEAGALKYRGTAGTITTIAPA